MKITGMSIEKVQVPLKEPFKIAFTTVSYLESVLVQVSTDNGRIGFGEAAPFVPVTSETVDGVIAAPELFRTGLLDMNPVDIKAVRAITDGVIVGNGAAKCAVDLAMYGLMGKSVGLPVYKLLGDYSNMVHNDIIIGTNGPQPITAEAKHLVETEGHHILKIKAGINYKDDILAMRLIRGVVGPDIRLWADTNQGYSVSDAVCALEGPKEYGIKVVEQCLPHWDIEGSAFIHSKVNRIQIMLGRFIHGPMDAAGACHLGVADTLNIKLVKYSGLCPTSKINAVAEANGVICMVGCILETELAITAELSLMAAKKNVTKADCGGSPYYKENPIEDGFTQERGIFILLNGPGFGVYFNM